MIEDRIFFSIVGIIWVVYAMILCVRSVRIHHSLLAQKGRKNWDCAITNADNVKYRLALISACLSGYIPLKIRWCAFLYDGQLVLVDLFAWSVLELSVMMYFQICLLNIQHHVKVLDNKGTLCKEGT